MRRDEGEITDRDVAGAVNAFRSLDPRMRLVVVALLVIAGIIFFVTYLHRGATTSGPTSSDQMLLGNPSQATNDPRNHDNYLMVKPYFALSYNDSKGIPNWVSWRVSAADLGDAPRKQEFDADESLPANFRQVTTHEYSRSGFDRGHMCPHSDRAANQAMSFATFIMTNVIPQAPNVNRKAWEQLESYGRDLVREQNVRLYVMAGPIGQGGRGSSGPKESIGGGVCVPAECWKIIVVLPEAGGDDLAKLSSTTRVISVDMPNDQDKVGEEWEQFRTSPTEIESKTGLHFFDRVRADIAGALRQKVDREPIPPPKPHHYNGGE